MKKLLTRSVTGLVYVLLLVLSILYHPLALTAFFLVVLVFSNLEFSRIIDSSWRPFFWVIPVYLFYTLGEIFSRAGWVYLFLLIPLLHAFIALSRGQDIRIELEKPAAGILYLSLPLGTIVQMQVDFLHGMVLPFFIMVWCNDTGAYLVGKSLGRHKLVPHISPKKTVEGLVGGILFALLAAFICSRFFQQLELSTALGMALVVATFATFGDLFESAMKRSAGIKDSGTLLPGHGGFLDRFDSIIFAAPATLVYLKIVTS